MTTYYVSSTTGNDSNSGTSQAAPFATLQQAADQTKPGDVVQVMNGEYTNPGHFDVLDISTSGTAGAPITYEAAPGQHPIIDSSGSWVGIADEGASYITISGFEVKGDAASISQSYAQNNHNVTTEGKGIAVWNSNVTGAEPTHVIVQSNTVDYEPGAGIWAGHGDYISILDNTAYNNAWWSPLADSGISVGWMVNSDSNTGYKIIVSGNTTYDNAEYIPTSSGIITDGNGIIVDSNNASGYNGRTLVENNLSYDNGGSGMHAEDSNHVDFLYNTAYNNGQIAGGDAGQIFAGDGSSDVTVENNIMVSPSGKPNSEGSGATGDYNVLFGGNVSPEGSHDLVADPKFVAPGSDFELQAGSPAIGSANPAFTVATDISGEPRPTGAGYDRGAYQYQGTIDKLVLQLSEDAWKGDAKFIVSIDGKQQGGIQTVTALHSLGQSEAFQFTGVFGAGTHDLAISFINDAYGGTPQTDRNLYVNSINYDGHQYSPPSGDVLAALYTNGTDHFAISA